MLKFKSIVLRIVPMILTLVLIVTIAVPAFASVSLDLPGDGDYYTFEYDSGEFAILECVPSGLYSLILVDDGTSLYFDPVFIVYDSIYESEDWLSFPYSYTQVFVSGKSDSLYFGIGLFDDEITGEPGLNATVAAFFDHDDELVTFAASTILYLVPCYESPDLNPTEYYEFTEEIDLQGYADYRAYDTSIPDPDGWYYFIALDEDGQPVFFSDSFFYSPEVDPMFTNFSDVVDFYYVVDNFGVKYKPLKFYVTSMVDAQFSWIEFFDLGDTDVTLGDQYAFPVTRLLLVRIPGPTEKLMDLWSAVVTWFVSSLFVSLGILYTADSGLTTIGVFAVACGGLTIVICIVVLIRSWTKRR